MQTRYDHILNEIKSDQRDATAALHAAIDIINRDKHFIGARVTT